MAHLARRRSSPWSKLTPAPVLSMVLLCRSPHCLWRDNLVLRHIRNNLLLSAHPTCPSDRTSCSYHANFHCPYPVLFVTQPKYSDDISILSSLDCSKLYCEWLNLPTMGFPTSHKKYRHKSRKSKASVENIICLVFLVLAHFVGENICKYDGICIVVGCIFQKQWSSQGNISYVKLYAWGLNVHRRAGW